VVGKGGGEGARRGTGGSRANTNGKQQRGTSFTDSQPWLREKHMLLGKSRGHRAGIFGDLEPRDKIRTTRDSSEKLGEINWETLREPPSGAQTVIGRSVVGTTVVKGHLRSGKGRKALEVALQKEGTGNKKSLRGAGEPKLLK